MQQITKVTRRIEADTSAVVRVLLVVVLVEVVLLSAGVVVLWITGG